MNNDDMAVAEDGFDSSAYFPVLTTFAAAKDRARTLSIMVDLSFLAGRDDDPTDDWRADMKGGLDNAFPNLRPDRRDEIERLLTSAFYAGCSQAALTAAARPEAAMRFARAKATLHELHYGEERTARTSAHELEARATAYLLARKLPIEASEAAGCAIDALRESGFTLGKFAVETVLEGASTGVQEREAWEAAGREYRDRQDSLVLSILDGEALA